MTYLRAHWPTTYSKAVGQVWLINFHIKCYDVFCKLSALFYNICVVVCKVLAIQCYIRVVFE